MIQPSSISGSGTLLEQLAGIGVLRRGEDGRRVAFLDQLAGREHGDAVAEHAHHRQVVADEDQRQVELGAEPAEEEEDLRLGRDVEAGDDLVGDDELGLERERPGDADPLALAAGKSRAGSGRGTTSGRPTMSRSSAARRLRAGAARRRGRTPRAGAPACVPMVSRGLSEDCGSWKIICSLARSGWSCSSSHAAMSTPS